MTLKDVYLADPNNPARLDVSFNQDGTKVEAARFLIMVRSLFFYICNLKFLKFFSVAKKAFDLKCEP